MARPLDILIPEFAAGSRRALAELISLVEDGTAPAAPPPRGLAHVVGITGSGGAGKSTLVGALIKHLRGLGKRVAVLACDPQSPLSGGALLGDRIRVDLPATDEGLFFRSMSTRGAYGGISQSVAPALAWLKAYGFDVIIVETVGVGQDQAAVRPLVDTLVLLVTPNTGDEVQWEKAGLIEVADLVVVNKSDLPGAERVRQQLTGALQLVPTDRPTPVLATTAASGQGVAELWAAIEAHPRS
ncbi:MAG: methylmalonyl Co-A mutase-associated GTPase MeaB [Pirellulales bacterium]|nr:methylmalonyl Co-A mutase-associated GTPase MeaB [Pirellulales bacterium]